MKGLLSGRAITEDGIVLASSYSAAKPRGGDLREWLRPKLSKCENELLDVLMSEPGRRFDKETLVSRTPSQYSVSSSTFLNGLSKLRSLEAAEGYGSEGVKAADVFFED